MAVVLPRKFKVMLAGCLVLLVMGAALAYVFRKELAGTANGYTSEQLMPFLEAETGQLEVLAIDPLSVFREGNPKLESAKPSLGLFHGYHVVGRVKTSKEAELDMVKQAIRDIDDGGDKWEGSIASCFQPRHGVRLLTKDGATSDLLICYECARTKIFYGDERVGTIYIGFDLEVDRATPDLLDKLLGKEVKAVNPSQP